MKKIISAILLTVYMVTNLTFSVSAGGESQIDYTSNLLGQDYYNCDSTTITNGGIMGDSLNQQKFVEELDNTADSFDGASIKLSGRKQNLFKKTITENLLGRKVKVSLKLKVPPAVLEHTQGGAKEVSFYYDVLYSDGTTNGGFKNIPAATTADKVSTSWQDFSVEFTIPEDGHPDEEIGLAEGQTCTGISLYAKVGGVYGLSGTGKTTAWIDCISAYVIPGDDELLTSVSSINAEDDADGKTEKVKLTVDTLYVNANGIEDMEVICDGKELGTDDFTASVSGKEITIQLTNKKYIKSFEVNGIKDIWGRTVNCDAAKLNITREKTVVSEIVNIVDADGKTTSIDVIMKSPAYVNEDSFKDMVVSFNGIDLESSAYQTVIGENKITINLTTPAGMKKIKVSGIKDVWGEDADCSKAYLYGEDFTHVDSIKATYGNDEMVNGIELELTTANVDETGLVLMEVNVDGTVLTKDEDYIAEIKSAIVGAKIVITFTNQLCAKDIEVSGINDKSGSEVDCTKAKLSIERAITKVESIETNVDAEGKTTDVIVNLSTGFVSAEKLTDLILTLDGKNETAFTKAVDGKKIILTLTTPTVINSCKVRGIKDLWGRDADCINATFEAGQEIVSAVSMELVSGAESGKHSGLKILFDSEFVTEEGFKNIALRVNENILGKGAYSVAIEDAEYNEKAVKCAIITLSAEQTITEAAISGPKDRFGRKIDVKNAVISEPVTRETYTKNAVGSAFTNLDTTEDISATIDSAGYKRDLDTTTAYTGAGSLKITGNSGSAPNVIWGKKNMFIEEAPDRFIVSFAVKKSDDLVMTVSDKHPVSGKGITGENADTSPTFTRVRIYLDAKYTQPGLTGEGTVNLEYEIIDIDAKSNDWQHILTTMVPDYSVIPSDAIMTKAVLYIRLDNGRGATKIVEGNVWIDNVKMLLVPDAGKFITTTIENSFVPVNGEENAKADKVIFKYDGPVGAVSESKVVIKEGKSPENLSVVHMPIKTKSTFDEESQKGEVSIVPENGFVNGRYYEVSLSDVQDIWGRKAEGEHKVLFRATDEFVLEPEANGGFMVTESGAKVKITNNAINARDAVLVTAIVEGTDIKSYNISDEAVILENGGSEVLDVSLSGDAGDKRIAFVWDTRYDRRPLSGIISTETQEMITNTGRINTPVSDQVGPEITYNEKGGDAVNGEVIINGNLNGIEEGRLASLTVYEKGESATTGLKWYDVKPVDRDGAYNFAFTLNGEADGKEYVLEIAAFGHEGEIGVFKYYSKQTATTIISGLTDGAKVADVIASENTFLTIDTSLFAGFTPQKQEEICASIANEIKVKADGGETVTVGDFKEIFNKYCVGATIENEKATLDAEMSAEDPDVYAYFDAFESGVKDSILGEIVVADLSAEEEKQMFCDKVITIVANSVDSADEIFELMSSTNNVTGIDFTDYNHLTDEKATILDSLAAKTDYTDCASVKKAFDDAVNAAIEARPVAMVKELVDNKDADGKTESIEAVLDTHLVDESSILEMEVTCNGMTFEKGVDFEASVVTMEDGNKKLLIEFTNPQAIETLTISNVKDVWGRLAELSRATIRNYNINTYTRNIIGDAFTNCDTPDDLAATVDASGYTRTIDTVKHSGTGSIKIEGASGANPNVFYGEQNMTRDDAPSKVIMSAFLKKTEDLVMTVSGKHPVSDGNITGENADTSPTFTRVRFYVDAKYLQNGTGEEKSVNLAAQLIDIDAQNNDWQYISRTMTPDYGKLPQGAKLTKLALIIRFDNGRGGTTIEQGCIWIDEVKVLRVPNSGEYPTSYIGSEPMDGSINAETDGVVFKFSGAVDAGSLMKGIVLVNEQETKADVCGVYDKEENITSIRVIPQGGFKNNTSYTVSITGLTDVWGEAVSGTFTSSFTTISKYDVTGSFVKVANGADSENITQLENGDIKAKFSMKNNTQNSAEVILVLAECNGDTIERFVLSPQYNDVAPGETRVLEATLTGVTAGEGKCLKAFLWNNVDEHLIMSRLEKLE